MATAIESVLNQTYQNIEIIILDDGSTDSTRYLFTSKYEYVAKYFFQENRGVSSARNNGFNHSQGELIAFLDSDDYFLPDNLCEKVDTLMKHPEIGWVFSDIFIETKGKNQYRRSANLHKFSGKLSTSSDIFDFLLQKGIFPNILSVLVRRQCIEQIGGFNEDLMAFEDCDFLLRLARNFKVKYLHKPLIVVGYNKGDSLSASRKRYLSTFQYIEIVKDQFPEETTQIGWPPRWSKWRADAHNYLGMEYLRKNEKKNARSQFLMSIRAYPLQKMVYTMLLRSLL